MTPFARAVAAVALVATAGVVMPAYSQTPKRAARPRTGSMRVIVRDRSGKPVQGVHVIISSTTRDTTTDATGTAILSTMRDGSYRLRFERDGYVTLEREVTVRNGLPGEIAVALSAAPAPVSVPVRPQPTAAPAPASPATSAGQPVNVSVPAFLDKNFIGRDPLKESVLGCTAGATTRLLQVRDPVAPHAHPNLDEILYVVAGEGAFQIRDQVTVVSAGSLSVIPRGVPHGIERRGRNPLVLISTLAGAPCQAGG